MGRDDHKGDKRPLQLLACLPPSEDVAEARLTYAQQVAGFLQGKLAWQTKEPSSLAELGKCAAQCYDLLLFNETSWQMLTRPFRETAVSPAQLTSSIWLIREPRWPVRRLLLVLRGEATDSATIAWGLKLTEQNNCTITLLVVCPADSTQEDQFGLLKANTTSGRYLHAALHQLATRQVHGVLKVSHGSPEHIVRQEVASFPYDLIILGSEPDSRLFCWRLDSLLDPLLQWTQQSILIAKPTLSETVQSTTHLVNFYG